MPSVHVFGVLICNDRRMIHVRYIGQRNLIYIFFVLALWRATGVYEVFFALTSFVHYFR